MRVKNNKIEKEHIEINIRGVMESIVIFIVGVCDCIDG